LAPARTLSRPGNWFLRTIRRTSVMDTFPGVHRLLHMYSPFRTYLLRNRQDHKDRRRSVRPRYSTDSKCPRDTRSGLVQKRCHAWMTHRVSSRRTQPSGRQGSVSPSSLQSPSQDVNHSRPADSGVRSPDWRTQRVCSRGQSVLMAAVFPSAATPATTHLKAPCRS
jgi:hypothetical protein